MLGLSTAVWLCAAYLIQDLPAQFPRGTHRLILSFIFIVFTATPAAIAVVVIPTGDLVACGILLLLEIVGPSIFLLLWIDFNILQHATTLKARSARLGVAFLLLCGIAIPAGLIFNAVVFPNPWNNSVIVGSWKQVGNNTVMTNPTAVVPPISFYLFLLGVSAFVLFHLRIHSTTLLHHHTPLASGLLCVTTVIVATIVFGYLCATHSPNSEIASARSLASFLLLVVPLFPMGGLSFIHAHVRLIDKFSVGFVVFGAIPLLVLIPHVGKMFLSTFVAIALPSVGIVWVCLAACRAKEGHNSDRSNLLWSFNGACCILVIPLGVFVPLVLSTPTATLSTANLHSGLIMLAVCFPGVYFVGIIARQIHQYEEEREQHKQQRIKDGNVMPVRGGCCRLLTQMCVRTIRSPHAGYWISHIGICLFVLATEVVLFRVAVPEQQWALWFLLLVAPTVHILGMNMTTPDYEDMTTLDNDTKDKATHKCVVCFGILLPLLIGTLMLSFRNHVEDEILRLSFASLGTAVLTILPFLSVSWLFLWSIQDAVRSLPKNDAARISTSATTAICCCTVLFPLGILVFILATNWWLNLANATVLLVTISVLAILCLIDVSVGTIAINTTFKSIQRERIAKESTVAVVQALEKIDVSIGTDVSRLMYDQIGGLSVTAMKTELEATGEERMVTALLEEHGEVVISMNDFEDGLETGRIVLCEKCMTDRSRYVRAAKSKLLCQACILDGTIVERRRELEAKKLADEGDRRMQEALRQERLKKKAEKRALKERETKAKNDAETCMAQSEWEKATLCYGEAIECNVGEAKYFYQRGLCHLQWAVEEEKRKRKKKHFAAALSDGDLCFHLRPTWTASFVLRGGALVGLERFVEALGVYHEGLVVAPECVSLIRGIENVERVARVKRANSHASTIFGAPNLPEPVNAPKLSHISSHGGWEWSETLKVLRSLCAS